MLRFLSRPVKLEVKGKGRGALLEVLESWRVGSGLFPK